MNKDKYTLQEVTTPAAEREWLDLPKKIYKGNRNWVCPLDVDVREVFDPAKNELFADGEAVRWVVRDRQGAVVGRIAAFYNREKAALLYEEIDRNPLFRGTVEKEDRSLMNICFVMADGYEELAPEFMEFTKERGIVGIKGHRLVGGFRASCYNALPVESVRVLVECMQEFAAKHAK